MKKIITLLLVLPFGAAVLADDHGENYRGMNLNKNFGVQFEICELREGKTMADVNKVNRSIEKVLTSIDSKGSILRLTPFYSHGTPATPAADFLDLFVAPIEEIGRTWTDFLSTSEGPKAYSNFQSAAKCHNKLAYGTPKMTKVDEMISSDERVITLNWCTPKAGVSYQQLKAKHESWLQANKDSFQAAAWSVIVPRQGAGNAQGRFAHMNVFTSLNQMFANEEWIANGGGRDGISDYYSSYADCDGDSSYTAEYIYKALN